MFRNYLAAALRNLVRNRLFAAITIAGLAVGFAAALLIALYVRDELTYDHWIPGHERIYRVAGHIVMQGNVERPNELAPLPPPMR
jgi:putative ABC transport system permease protein